MTIIAIELSLRRPDWHDSICQGNCSWTAIQAFDPALCRDSVNSKKSILYPSKQLPCQSRRGSIQYVLSKVLTPNVSALPRGRLPVSTFDRTLFIIGVGRKQLPVMAII